MSRPSSVLIAEDGAEIVVRVLPPPHGPGHDQSFANYLAARAYAFRLRTSFGWRVVDRCEARTKLRALQRG